MSLPPQFSFLPPKSKDQLLLLLAKYPADNLPLMKSSRKCWGCYYSKASEFPTTRIKSSYNSEIKERDNKKSPVFFVDVGEKDNAMCTKVSLDYDYAGFFVEVCPFKDLWIESPVLFHVVSSLCV